MCIRDSPFSDDYLERDAVLVPGASNDVNSEMCYIVRKFHELDDRVDDFEVNVASLARVQFQFTGFLLHEMAQIFTHIVDLNRMICRVQNNVIQTGNVSDMQGLFAWRLVSVERFVKLLQKYKVSTVVLRLYLKDSITLLTRQRELLIAHQRHNWNGNTDDTEPDDDAFWQQIGERVPLSQEQMRIIQFGGHFRYFDRLIGVVPL